MPTRIDPFDVPGGTNKRQDITARQNDRPFYSIPPLEEHNTRVIELADRIATKVGSVLGRICAVNSALDLNRAPLLCSHVEVRMVGGHRLPVKCSREKHLCVPFRMS